MSNVMSLEQFQAQNPQSADVEVVDAEVEEVDMEAHTVDPSAIFPRNQNIFFPVVEMPLEIRGVNGQVMTVPKKKVIVREDTNETLGIHSSSYKLVKNEEVFPQFEEALLKSSIDLTDMRVVDSTTFNGARAFREYYFPAHKMRINSFLGDDEVDLKLRLFNSYDASHCFGFSFGAFRLVCSNGLVIGHNMNTQYVRHTSNLDTEKLLASLEKSFEIYTQHQDIWNHWANKQITDEQVSQILDRIQFMSKRLKESLTNYWLIEVSKLGRTVWALFNALTYWSTHHKIRESAASKATDVIIAREARVQALLNSDEFQRLAA